MRRYLPFMPIQILISSIISLLLVSVLIFFLFKGVHVRKQRTCAKDQWTTIISNFGTGIPRTFRITFTTKDGKILAGKYIEQRYFWIFPQSPSEGDLKPTMNFHRNWINAIYKLKIFPDTDVGVTIR